MFCEKKHKTGKCGVVTELQARKSLIKRKKLCFTSWKPSHVAKECKSEIFFLSKKKHAALCSNDKKKENTNLTAVAVFQGSYGVTVQE